jgi:hypothetical protein
MLDEYRRGHWSDTMKTMPFAAMLALAMSFASDARAQYDPGGTMNLGMGMGATALGQSILSGTRNIGKKPRHSDELSPTMKEYCAQWPSEGVCKADRARRARRQLPTNQASRPSREEISAKMRTIAPEYNRRVRLYGKPKADLWLAQTAREIGRRDGTAARKASGR